MNRVVSQLLIFVILIPMMAFAACSQDEKVMVVKEKDGPWLGVRIENLSEKMLKNLKIENGVRISKVLKGSPAEEAGLEDDDILVSFNGDKLYDSEDLVKRVNKSDIDDEITIGYYRNGEQKEVSVKLAKNEKRNVLSWYGKSWPHKTIKAEKQAWLGVEIEELNDQLREFFAVPENSGVLVKKVVQESPAEKAGIKAGDVIIKVADRDIKNNRDLVRSVNYYDPDEKVEITLVREKKEKSITVKLGEKEGFGNFRFYGLDGELIEIPEMDFTVPEIEVHTEFDENAEDHLEEIQEKLQKMEKDKKVRKIKIKKYGDEV